MRCIKTGCIAKLLSHGEYVLGDAFMVNDVLIIRTSWRGATNPRDLPIDFKVHDVEQWWEDEPTGTLITRGYSIIQNGREK